MILAYFMAKTGIARQSKILSSIYDLMQEVVKLNAHALRQSLLNLTVQRQPHKNFQPSLNENFDTKKLRKLTINVDRNLVFWGNFTICEPKDKVNNSSLGGKISGGGPYFLGNLALRGG